MSRKWCWCFSRRLWLAISTRLEAKQEEQRRSNVEMYIEERRARLIEANKAA